MFLGTVDASNVAFAALEGARLATLLIVFGTFNAVTDPFGVVRLAPRRFHEPALAAALALSIAPRTVAMVGRVREAQPLRGIRDRRGGDASRRSPSRCSRPGWRRPSRSRSRMDARGHGRGRRTRYRPARWTPGGRRDVVVRRAGGGRRVRHGRVDAARRPASLDRPARRGPTRQPALVVAIALLAVPGLLPRKSPAEDDMTEALRFDDVSFRYPDAARRGARST